MKDRAVAGRAGGGPQPQVGARTATEPLTKAQRVGGGQGELAGGAASLGALGRAGDCPQCPQAQLHIEEEKAGGPWCEAGTGPARAAAQRAGGKEPRGPGASRVVEAVQEKGVVARICHPALRTGRDEVPAVCSAGGNQVTPLWSLLPWASTSGSLQSGAPDRQELAAEGSAGWHRRPAPRCTASSAARGAPGSRGAAQGAVRGVRLPSHPARGLQRALAPLALAPRAGLS